MIEKLYNIGKLVLLLFLIVYVGSLIDWFFSPLRVAFQTLFVPLVVAGFLYYLLRPFVHLLQKKLPKSLAIVILYGVLIALIVVGLAALGPILQDQTLALANNMPAIIAGIESWVLDIDLVQRISDLQEEPFIDADGLIDTATESLNQLGRGLVSGFGSFVGTIASAVLVLVLLPILLFYALKDSGKLRDRFVTFFPEKRHDEVRRILQDIDSTLSSYIQGQGIVCLLVGTLCLIAFLIIGLEYALLLAVIAGVTNLIPYFGPWIGSIPAVTVALFTSPWVGLVTILAVVVIQQIESNLIAPQVIGKKLRIHPVTIIFLILIAGQLFGLLGMILAVPVYASLRVLLTSGVRIWKLRLDVAGDAPPEEPAPE